MMICENDHAFIFFFLTAFLSYKREYIASKDYSQIPSMMSNLSIASLEESHAIYELACIYRDRTPKSFNLYLDHLEIFTLEKKRKANTKIDKLTTIPFMPSELLYCVFSKVIKCPNVDCTCFGVRNNKNNNMLDDYHGLVTEIVNHSKVKNCYNRKSRDRCDYCRQSCEMFPKQGELSKIKLNKYSSNGINSELNSLEKKLREARDKDEQAIRSAYSDSISNNIMILDIRVIQSSNDERSEGFLPMTISVPYEELLDENVSLIQHILVRRELHGQLLRRKG